jgi:L-asparaginase / beta-aspartyl-peptidase
MPDPAIIVHGGAWDIPDSAVFVHKSGCKNAVEIGWNILANYGTALDAVTQAVVSLENDPTFDAGKGAFLNQVGQIELDASIMDGSNLDAGSVAALGNFQNPVLVARKVMESTEHVLLVGKGAEQFVLDSGFSPCKTEELLVGRELERYRQLLLKKDFHAKQVFEKHPKGTVGAVAIDRDGNLAAATSTGGTPQKMQGRVGDTPIIGAGTFADNELGAVSCTGWGESILKTLLAKTACDLLEISENVQEACESAINVLENKVAGRGGLILISNLGKIGFAFNTPRMVFAYKTHLDEKIIVGI